MCDHLCNGPDSVFIAKPYQALGIGTQLLATTLQWIDDQHAALTATASTAAGAATTSPGSTRADVWIGVWSENHGAQRMYERFGFRRVGEYYFHLGAVDDLEFIMRRVRHSLFVFI